MRGITDKQNSLIGAGISDAHLSWLHLSASNTKVSVDNLYWPDMKESDLRGNIIEKSEDIEEIMKLRLSSSKLVSSSSQIHRLAEQLFHEGDTLNLAAQRPLTREDQAERERLAHIFAGDLCRSYKLRAYDAVQLACALHLRDKALAKQAEIPTFISADIDLISFAAAEKLEVEDPNRHP